MGLIALIALRYFNLKRTTLNEYTFLNAFSGFSAFNATLEKTKLFDFLNAINALSAFNTKFINKVILTLHCIALLSEK